MRIKQVTQIDVAKLTLGSPGQVRSWATATVAVAVLGRLQD
jgi:hypothetical protein